MSSPNMDESLLRHFNLIEENHWWWMGRRQLLKQLIPRNPNQKILDIGCGTGETLSYIHTLYNKSQLYGVDTSDVAINFAKKRGHKNIQKASALKLPFTTGTFDVVLFLDVLEHIPTDEKALLEAKRVLIPGGVIIITAPALQFIWSRHDTMQDHVRRYTRRRIRYLSKRTGLSINFLSYFNFFLSPPIILLRLLSNLKVFSRFSEYDNGMNFEIANKNLINNILTKLFVFEIKLLKYVNYPLGISLGAVLKKLS
jgi:ubiquinone/menaquinone biosynthesis C-methylase UbiE